jgi:hypothetical protein
MLLTAKTSAMPRNVLPLMQTYSLPQPPDARGARERILELSRSPSDSHHRLINWTWPEYDSRDLYLDIGAPPLVMSGFSTITTKQPPR